MTNTSAATVLPEPEEAISETGVLPVSLSAEGLRAAAGSETDGPAVGIPQDGSELSSLQQESYQLQASFAAKLGFPMASLSTDDKMTVMLYGLTRYSDVFHNHHTYRYGVAIRVLLEIYSDNLDGNLTLPVIAAKAQLGVVSASAQLLLYGYTGDLAEALPNWQSFDVDSYADYLKSVSALQAKVFSDPSKIRPVLLSSTLAASLKPKGGEIVTRHGATPAADLHRHRVRDLMFRKAEEADSKDRATMPIPVYP